MKQATSDLLTTAEVLDYLKISKRTLYRLLSLGDFPAAQVKIGAQSRWTRLQLDGWVRAGGRRRAPLGRPRKSATPPRLKRCAPRRRLAEQQS